MKECVWLCNMWNIIWILDYARSKEKNWKRKEMEKGFMTENEELV